MTKQIEFLLAVLCLAVSLTAPALAEDDHHRAYRLRQQARVLPLEQILDRLRLDPGSRILELEAETKHGQPVYEIEILRPDGRVRKVTVDAVSGIEIRRQDD
jgi:uncharacterized membrane protein YkoI